MTTVFMVAGESSGDLHGANLIRAIRAVDAAVYCEGVGGVEMARVGMTLRHDLASHAIMGFVEVVRSLPYIRWLFNDTVARLEELNPDCLVLIDYPGFNIRMAKCAQILGIPVVYYISPQVWAWKKRRIHTLARLVRKMLVILPFEEDLYKNLGVDCQYVGHPLLDHVAKYRPSGERTHSKLIALLPGSREQEIRRILPVMIEIAEAIRSHHRDAHFIIPCVDEARGMQIRGITKNFPAEVVIGKTYDVLSQARFALVASGTATVETALFKVPFVVIYKVALITYLLARMLVRVDHICMVNILAGREIVPEFIQHEATASAIVPRALTLIEDSPERSKMIEELEALRVSMGQGGASKLAAEAILAVAQRGAYEQEA